MPVLKKLAVSKKKYWCSSKVPRKVKITGKIKILPVKGSRKSRKNLKISFRNLRKSLISRGRTAFLPGLSKTIFPELRRV